MPQLADDERFSTISLRARHQVELAALLQPAYRRRTAAQWLEEFDRRGVPSAPIYDFSEVLSDPHVEHMGWVEPMTLPNGVTTKTVGFPVKISNFQFRIKRQPPVLGEHNEEVYAQWLGEAARANA
jgi:crotonobetainyl-CoA:carnitine CoA-transferase CaiB-like acyl-CoA transferase